MSKLIVDVLAGVPGCGKSTKMLNDAAETPGRYLFCLPTIKLISEQAAVFRALNPRAQCLPIHSETGARSTVERQIADCGSQSADGDHIAVFVTHEAMMQSDLATLTGWHARIDEPPNAIMCGQISIAESVAAFENRFDLAPFGGGWSKLVPKRGKEPWTKIAKDTLWRSLGDLLNLAHRPQGVLIQLDNWSRATNDVPVSWFSLWTPLQMSAFDSIVIAGASFLSSTAYGVMASTYPSELDFRVENIGSARSGHPCVRIGYFTDRHSGSTTYWSTSEGRKCLVDIERWLSANVPDLGYWSGNEQVRNSFEHRVPGSMTSPKVAGINGYRDRKSCAMFYSSKPLPVDVTLKTVFELTDDDILLGREVEDMFQFAFRGAIRNRDYAGPYDIYLYSRDQAERLRARMEENGLTDVEIVAIPEAGIMDILRPESKAKPMLTQAEAEAKAQRKREANARRNQELRDRKKALRDAT